MASGRREAGLLDLVSTGLGFEDLADLSEYREVRASNPDAAGEVPDHPIVRRGDVWTLGDHRLMCGDSTSAADVRLLLGEDRPYLMVTDPPYGVEYSPDWRNKAFRSDGSPIAGKAVGAVANDARVDWTAAWRLFSGDVAYVWHAGRYAALVQQSLEKALFSIRCQIIWNKSRFVIGRGDYHWKHEPCWYAVRKGARGHWNGARDQTTVWDIAHTVSDSGHGTQKPVECMRRPIVNNSREGDAIYEPFSGSGTTIIAAEETRRRCLAMELSPLYVYVAVTRWQNYVGRSATLDGEPFADVVRRRRAEPAPVEPTISQVTLPSQNDLDDVPEMCGFEEPAPPPVPAAPLPADLAAVEAAVAWYSAPGDVVVDPGDDPGRRLVAERLGRRYAAGGAGALLLWVPGAPSDDYAVFLGDYAARVRAAVAGLGRGRAAALVSDHRDPASGQLVGFVWHTVAAFQEAGARLADEVVLAPAAPTALGLARRAASLIAFEVG